MSCGDRSSTGRPTSSTKPARGPPGPRPRHWAKRSRTLPPGWALSRGSVMGTSVRGRSEGGSGQRGVGDDLGGAAELTRLQRLVFAGADDQLRDRDLDADGEG
ncbi:MAG: hypothetical protein ACK559_21840, partial [bacterium]